MANPVYISFFLHIDVLVSQLETNEWQMSFLGEVAHANPLSSGTEMRMY